MLEWLAEEFDEKRRTSYVPSTKGLGEMFRSDAKAEGQKVVVGGWELAGSERACDARRFALEVSSAEIPWAYERGDPFKAILFATLLCLVVFGVPGRGASRGTVSLTASGDNRSNGVYSGQVRHHQVSVGLGADRPRAPASGSGGGVGRRVAASRGNTEEDALKNHDYTAFDPAKRVAVAWRDLKFGVLDRLVAKAKLFHQHLSDLKRVKVVHEDDQRKKGKRKKLKVTDPW